MIWFALLLPLLLAGVLALAELAPQSRNGRWRDRLTGLAWTAVLPLGAAVLLVDDGEHRVGWLLLGTGVQLDALGRPLLAMAVVLYGLALAFVPRSGSEHRHVLASGLLLCLLGNTLTFVASDVVTFYLGFTLVSFVGYALVVHHRTDASRRAGGIYLVLTVLGESAVLAALLLVAGGQNLAVAEVPAVVADSPYRDLVIALLVLGFGVKAGTVPLHVWLPLAHPAAPTPASAVLSAVMVKAGLVGWLRFLPLGETSEPGWALLLLVLALAGGFLAVPIGLLQDDPKVVLAYSSISQMGFLGVLVAVALAEPGLAAACVTAAVVYAVHHGVVKGVLFLGVQAWDGERLPRRLVAAVMVVAGVSLVGAPLSSGYVAKYGAKEAVGDAELAGTGLLLADLLPWVGVGSALLLARFAVVLARRERHPRERTPRSRAVVWLLAVPVAAVAVGALGRAGEPRQQVPPWFDAATWWDQGWPLLLGLGLAVAAERLSRRLPGSRLAHPHGDVIPPGDLVALEERAVRAAGRGLLRVQDGGRRGKQAAARRLAALPSPGPGLDDVQRRLGGWVGSGLVLLVLLGLALAVLVWADLSPVVSR